METWSGDVFRPSASSESDGRNTSKPLYLRTMCSGLKERRRASLSTGRRHLHRLICGTRQPRKEGEKKRSSLRRASFMGTSSVCFCRRRRRNALFTPTSYSFEHKNRWQTQASRDISLMLACVFLQMLATSNERPLLRRSVAAEET